ncbi:Uncharacterized protein PRO82_000572 [Candidatus Protochlamydia amoebophila]|nr:Uncharacterized protein [Candidatus Protochlamydia amoebophila]
MLQNAGAQFIVSIKAHPRAYLRYLIVKEVLKLNRAEFHFEDFMQYLRQSSSQFDLDLTVGVLYHSQQLVPKWQISVCNYMFGLIIMKKNIARNSF